MFFSQTHRPYLEDGLPVDGSVVKKHGDCKSPNWGCGTPSIDDLFVGLKNGVDPNYLLPAFIHQAWDGNIYPAIFPLFMWPLFAFMKV